jgi:hypothetical protein
MQALSEIGGTRAASTAKGPATLVLLGHVLMAASLFVSDGFDQIGALLLMMAACAAWGAALVGLAGGATVSVAGLDRWIWGAALGSGLLGYVRPPGAHLSAGLGLFRALLAVVVVALASYAIDLFDLARVSRGAAIARRGLLFSLALAIGAWILHACPEPPIDLFPLHQQAAEALLHGKSIYEPGNIDTWTTYVHQHAKIDEYVYLPLGAYFTTIAYVITHDIRWADLAGILLGGAFLWMAARRAFTRVAGEERAAIWADLVTALFLFHPRGWLVLEMAWTEPLCAPFLAGFVAAALARRRALACVCLGLLVAGKQHLVLYVPYLMMVPGIGLGGAILAGLVGLATVAPFAIWTPYGLLRGIWLLHKNGPFRSDALSVPAELSSRWLMPAWVGFLAAVAPLASIPRLPRRLAPLLLGSCATFMLFYLLGRQAFLNYYWLLDLTGLLALATLPEAEASAA